jgi:hypothetical protein
MIVYHGTTDRRARKIAAEGLLPRKPSRRVWFAASRRYAWGRAKTQARRSRARAVVLTCEIDVAEFRRKLGPKRVRKTSGILAIEGPVPATVLRSCGEPFDQPSSPRELAEWINRVLGVKPHKGVSPKHPGVVRLSRWVVNRAQGQPRRGIKRAELLHVARQWLGEFFEGVEIDPDDLVVYRMVSVEPLEAGEAEPQADPREEEALELLDGGGPRQRIRALGLLADVGDPDLFGWCAMCLEDESAAVRLAALRTMVRCEAIDPAVVAPFAESQDNRTRAAAIAVLAKHDEENTAAWFERGLKDPSPCVRLEVAHVLEELDPVEHRGIFRLALYDPNPQIAAIARKLVAGKGYPKVTWGVGPSHYGEAEPDG